MRGHRGERTSPLRDCLEGPQMRDHNLHTERQCHFSRGLWAPSHFGTIAEASLWPLLPPAPLPLPHPPLSSHSDLVNMSQIRSFSVQNLNGPSQSEVKLNPSNCPQGPACPDPGLTLSHPPPHSLCSSHTGPLDIYRHPAQSDLSPPSACNAFSPR